MSAIESFNAMYEKIKVNDWGKHDELIVFSGRQSGKSWFMQQYMTQWFMEPTPPFARVQLGAPLRDMIVCDVNQDIQDWLMQNFEPSKLWKYFTTKDIHGNYPAKDRERVAMRNDIYTALVLRWS
jgi:hypothetical protein